MKLVIFVPLTAAVVMVVGAPGIGRAQSLADVAKKEAERREAIKAPTKTYTNKDLAGVPPATAAKPAEAAPADAKDAAKDEKEKPVRDQKYWSSRRKELQTQLDRDQAFVDALQSQINGLTADFSARDDPAQRAQIGAARQKALDEQNRLKEAITNDKKAITDLEEEARKANVPPGWLRS